MGRRPSKFDPDPLSDIQLPIKFNLTAQWQDVRYLDPQCLGGCFSQFDWSQQDTGDPDFQAVHSVSRFWNCIGLKRRFLAETKSG